MSHLPILPILVPLLAGALLMVLHARPLRMQRAIALGSVGLGGLCALLLLQGAAGGQISVYALGNWPAPYGIVLVVDRLAALMVLLVYLVAAPALIMATDGFDAKGRHFHALFQLQLAGLAGAFLTGDIFNLFVCFEILLLASYALLVHGAGPERARAGLAYVILNLAGSTLFLVAIAILYGTLGTLNIADIALRLPLVSPGDAPLVRTGLMLLVVVFLLKGALLPLGFWLTHVYPAATVPVGALFAIMTKVGIVALIRLDLLALDGTEVAEGLFHPWLRLLALLTIALGTIGAFAARRLAVVAANLVVISSGTLLFAAATPGPDATAALLYYLPHTTLITSGLFLLAGAIAERRGAWLDRLKRGPVIEGHGALALAFLVLAVAGSGLPPLSGFIGKLMLMQGAGEDAWRAAWWSALLLSGLGVALVLARVASTLFWEPAGYADSPVEARRLGRAPAAALVLAVAASPALTVGAAPVAAYARETASQMHARTLYGHAVIPPGTAIQREWRPAPPEPPEAR
jgi:multicomponent K+:H+ antiporter subunit D